MQAIDSAMPHSSKAAQRASARQRHALFNDYNLSIPWGIVNGAAGLLSLPFKVIGSLAYHYSITGEHRAKGASAQHSTAQHSTAWHGMA